MRAVARAARAIWRHVTDPYELRPLYFTAYLTTLVAGIVTLTTPPASIQGHIGEALAAAWAFLYILGGIIGVATVYSGWWGMERAAIILAWGGLAVYGSVIAQLHVWSPPGSSRLTQAAIIILAAILFGVRWKAIATFTFAPRCREE